MTVTTSTAGVRIAIGETFSLPILMRPLRSIDRGGTFTDVWASLPGKPDAVIKLLSVDPANYADAPTEGDTPYHRSY